MATDVKDYLRSEMEQHLKQATDIADLAEGEARNPTDEERETVKNAMAKATEIKGRLKEIEDNERLRNSIEELGKSLTGTPEVVPEGEATSVGEAFVRSQGYKGLVERGLAGKWRTGPVVIPSKLWHGSKATLTLATGDNAEVPITQRIPGILGPVEQRLTVADLMAQGTVTSGNTVVYVKETVTTNAAAVIAEGVDKPESTIGFDTASAALKKIATFLPVSDEALEDIEQLRSYLDDRLRFFVLQEEEDQLLNGAGGANIDGILNQTTNIAVGSDIGGDSGNWFDAIYAAITDVRINAQMEPDAMVLHPSVMAELQVQKASTAGTYFSGGPYAVPLANPWGLRTVVTTAMDANHILVGAFRQAAQVWRKGGLTVEASNSHDDFFQKNLTAIRAEERVALTVFRPQAFSVARQGS